MPDVDQRLVNHLMHEMMSVRVPSDGDLETLRGVAHSRASGAGVRNARWQRALSWSLLALAISAPLRAEHAAVSAAPDTAEPALRVTLLGTGRPDPAIDRFGPSTLVEAGGETLLFDVDHGGLLEPAYGYRVDYGGHSVVISGDTRPSETLVSAAAGADVIVHEVIAAPPALLERSETARRIVGFHTLPEDAGRIFARVRPRLAVYSHVVLLTTDPAFPAPAVSHRW